MSAYNAENEASRQRLKALADRLTDAQLATPMENDWTVSAYLAHIAFFDRRALLLTRLRRDLEFHSHPD